MKKRCTSSYGSSPRSEPEPREDAPGVGVDDEQRAARRRRARSSRRSPGRCPAPRGASGAARAGLFRAHRLDPPAVLRAEEVEEGPQPPRLHAEGPRGAEERREPRRRRGGRAPRTREGPRARSGSSVRSTFAQAVFWTRIAPTHTSNGDSPGHQPGVAEARPQASVHAQERACRRLGRACPRRCPLRATIAARGGPFVDTPRSRAG